MAYKDCILAIASLRNYWRCAETSGTTLADAKGSDTSTLITGMATNGAALATGLSPHSVILNTSAAHSTSVDTINSTHSSVIMWVNLTNFNTPDSVVRLALGGLFDGTSTYDHTLYGVKTTSSTGKFGFYIFDGAAKRAESAGTYNAAALHMLVGTCDGSNVKIYVDGSLDGTTAAGNAFAAYSGAGFRIGVCASGAGEYSEAPPFDASDIAFCTNSLSADLITLLYNAAITPNSGSFTDNFTRANSTTSAGPNWIPLNTAAVWGINTDEAYVANFNSEGGASIAHDCGSGDGTVSVTFDHNNGAGSAGSNVALTFRIKDKDSRWIWQWNSSDGLCRLIKDNAGTTTTLFTSGSVIVTPSPLKVVLNGSSIQAFAGGTSLTTQTDSFLSTQPLHGFGTDNTSNPARFSLFSFTVPVTFIPYDLHDPHPLNPLSGVN